MSTHIFLTVRDKKKSVYHYCLFVHCKEILESTSQIAVLQGMTLTTTTTTNKQTNNNKQLLLNSFCVSVAFFLPADEWIKHLLSPTTRSKSSNNNPFGSFSLFSPSLQIPKRKRENDRLLFQEQFSIRLLSKQPKQTKNERKSVFIAGDFVREFYRRFFPFICLVFLSLSHPFLLFLIFILLYSDPWYLSLCHVISGINLCLLCL